MKDYLKRKIDSFLVSWKENPERKPLIIKGARQVGKTKSILTFASSHYDSVVSINFAEDPIYKQIIENGYSTDAVIKNISRINADAKFVDGKTLIFFDEIQEFPDITTTLKFFSLDGRFDIICSGSLLGIHYKEISSISVGYKTEVEMRSLDFEEFLWALGYDDSIKDDILEHMRSFTPFSPAVLKIYNDLFLDYCIVGGMPNVVYDFVNKKTFENTLDLQRQIVIGYEADIRKYASGLDKARVANVFRSVPFQLGKENKKFQISKVRSGAKFKDYRGSRSRTAARSPMRSRSSSTAHSARRSTTCLSRSSSPRATSTARLRIPPGSSATRSTWPSSIFLSRRSTCISADIPPLRAA